MQLMRWRRHSRLNANANSVERAYRLAAFRQFWYFSVQAKKPELLKGIADEPGCCNLARRWLQCFSPKWKLMCGCKRIIIPKSHRVISAFAVLAVGGSML